MSRVGPARLLIACAVGFLVLGAAVRAAGADRALFLAVNGASQALPGALWSCATVLGHGLSAVMLLAPTLLRSTGRLAAGLYATPVALLLSRLPKALIDSPRPAAVLDPTAFHIEGIRLAAHNSFPSGHAITAFLVVGVLLARDLQALPRAAPALAIAAAGAAVAVSRIAVGAHWPSDVLAGAGLGLLAGVAGAAAQQRWPLGSRPLAQALMALAVAACAVVLARTDTGYPLARPLQWSLSALGAASAGWTLWRAWSMRGGAQRRSG
jgi:membrane-associated phospholipid phosphatase